jgi:hypothetical protein
MTPDQLAELKARVTQAVEDRGGIRRKGSSWWTFPCPNGSEHKHGDRRPSAGWDADRGVWKCFGCSLRGGTKDLAERLGIALPPQRDPRETCRWEIRDTGGRVHAHHIRLEPGRDGKSKDCVWERPDGRKGLGGTKTCDLPLYGAHTLARLAPGATVVVTEGEPACDALAAHGILAVGTVTGAWTIPSDDVLRVLVGYDVVCWPDADAPGRRHMERLAARLRALGATVRWSEPWPDATDGRDAADFTGTTGELRALIGAAACESTAAPTESAALPGVLLADVVPEAVLWLWHPRLPRGKVVLLEGDPDEGKSSIALDLAARISAGAPMPFETVGRPAAGVVVLSAEDGLADTIQPRLEAAGADLSRIVSERLEALPTLDDAGIAHIRALIARVEAVLVVLDPLMAFVPDAVDTHKDHHSRRLLRKLAALAEETGATVLVLRHLRKGSGHRPKDAGGGSVAYTAAARVVLLAATDPGDETRKVLARVKGNLAAPFPALAYRLPAPDGVVRVEWLGETAHTAAELLQEPDDEEERGALEEAEAWLRDFLAAGARPPTDVIRAGKRAGHAERTLWRAKRRARVVSEKETGTLTGSWFWKLPGDAGAVESSPKAANEAEGCQDSGPQKDGSLRGSWQPSGVGADDVEVF